MMQLNRGKTYITKIDRELASVYILQKMIELANDKNVWYV
jgi:hypothetical protein